MDKKKFAAEVLNLKHKIFIVYVTSLSSVTLPNSSLLNIHPFCKPQIAGLIVEKTPIKILAKYANFANVFSLELVFKPSEYIRINNYTIKLVNANKFSRSSKSPVGTSILSHLF